jgi:hypothetical protein
MAISGKPSACLTHHLKLIIGQRLLRFSILKETPIAPIIIAGEAQKNAAAGEFLFRGYPGRL